MKDLKDKITSEAELSGHGSPFRHMTGFGGESVAMAWWLKREWLRIEKGIYPTSTEVIDTVNAYMPQLAVHVSKEDSAYIAYTPDKVMGEADRQLKTSLGKFLTKYYPQLPDTRIGQLVAEHLGELNGEFETLTGPDIAKVYAQGGGTGACMSKFSRSADVLGVNYPTDVYDAPNISMAVLRDQHGNVTARCMLYTPTPTDKRFIRVYGDQKLRKKLERAGYVVGRWHGAKFKTIPLGDNKYVLPYLDGNGAAGSTGSSCVAIIDGVLTSITDTLYNKFRSDYFHDSAVCAINTSGWTSLRSVSSAEFYRNCAVSGKIVNTIEELLHDYWLNGEIVKVCDEVMAAGLELYRRSRIGQTPSRIICAENTPYFVDHGGRLILDNTDQRVFAGQVKLSATYYPDEQEWVQSSLGNTTPTVSGVIKTADAVLVIQMSGDFPRSVFVHQQDVTAGYVKVHSTTRGVALWAAPDVKVVKTPTGRKVVPGVHEVKQTTTGTWEFLRNLRQIRFMGALHYVTNGTVIPGYHNVEGRALVRQMLEQGDNANDVATSILNAAYPYARADGDYMCNAPSILTASQLVAKYRLNDAMAMCLKYALDMIQAEAEALDYNDQHVGPERSEPLPDPAEVLQPVRVEATQLPSGAASAAANVAMVAYLNTHATATTASTVTAIPHHYMYATGGTIPIANTLLTSLRDTAIS